MNARSILENTRNPEELENITILALSMYHRTISFRK
jgi:hypothetical protein